MKRLALLALAVSLIASCSTIESCRDEIWVRHDAETDRLDILLVSEGISANAEPRAALDLARRILQGDRLIYGGWLFVFDLDDPDAFKSLDDYLVFQNVRVVAAEAYLDSEGRLSWAQHFCIRHASTVVGRVNSLLREMVLEEFEEETSEDSAMELQVLRAFLDDETNVLTLQGAQLEVRVPMQPSEAWRIEQDLKNGRGLGGLQGVTSWHITDGTIRWTFGEPEEKEWTASFNHAGMEYQPGLLEALNKEDRLRLAPSKETVLANYRAAAEAKPAPEDGERRPIGEER